MTTLFISAHGILPLVVPGRPNTKPGKRQGRQAEERKIDGPDRNIVIERAGWEVKISIRVKPGAMCLARERNRQVRQGAVFSGADGEEEECKPAGGKGNEAGRLKQ